MAAVLVIWIFIIIKNSIQRALDQQDFNVTVKDAEEELKDAIKNKPLTYPEAVYAGWANQIFSLIDGCDFWTNGTKIVEVFNQLMNDSDYLMLVSKFGVRTIENCGPFTGSYEADLPSAFKKENITGLAAAINEMFGKRGMKSRI